MSELVNTTTLGPYSFRVFIDCGWTEKRMASVPKPVGRRASEHVDHGKRKRPTVEAIARTGKKTKKAVPIGVAPLELMDSTGGLEPERSTVVNGRRLRERKGHK